MEPTQHEQNHWEGVSNGSYRPIHQPCSVFSLGLNFHSGSCVAEAEDGSSASFAVNTVLPAVREFRGLLLGRPGLLREFSSGPSVESPRPRLETCCTPPSKFRSNRECGCLRCSPGQTFENECAKEEIPQLQPRFDRPRIKVLQLLTNEIKFLKIFEFENIRAKSQMWWVWERRPCCVTWWWCPGSRGRGDRRSDLCTPWIYLKREKPTAFLFHFTPAICDTVRFPGRPPPIAAVVGPPRGSRGAEASVLSHASIAEPLPWPILVTIPRFSTSQSPETGFLIHVLADSSSVDHVVIAGSSSPETGFLIQPHEACSDTDTDVRLHRNTPRLRLNTSMAKHGQVPPRLCLTCILLFRAVVLRPHFRLREPRVRQAQGLDLILVYDKPQGLPDLLRRHRHCLLPSSQRRSPPPAFARRGNNSKGLRTFT